MSLAKYMEDNIKQADDRARELYEYNEYMDERYPRSAPREPQEERDEKKERARARVEAELIAAREAERQAESKLQTQNKGQTKNRAKEKQNCRTTLLHAPSAEGWNISPTERALPVHQSAHAGKLAESPVRKRLALEQILEVLDCKKQRKNVKFRSNVSPRQQMSRPSSQS